MELGLVSIITPVYNSERFLDEAIKSVLKQSYKNWEMIIVNDCSNDSSETIIKKYMNIDHRIKYIKLEERSGVVKARNAALQQANGQYIAFLDSDDIWKENKIEVQIEFMNKHNVGFTFTAYEIIDEDGVKIRKPIKVPNKIDYKGYLKNTIIGCLSVVIDRKITGDIRIVDSKIEDFATWLQVLKKIKWAYGINEVLAEYRIVKGSSSYNKTKAAKGAWSVYREIENLNFLVASSYFLCYSINAIKKRCPLF